MTEIFGLLILVLMTFGVVGAIIFLCWFVWIIADCIMAFIEKLLPFS